MNKPLVSIVMGSSNDWEIMQQAARALQDFGITFDAPRYFRRIVRPICCSTTSRI